MLAEIITIGDELLIGQTIDTNSAWIGEQLSLIGIKVHQTTSITDDEEHILTALTDASKRVQLIILTGGLGPTKDDITKHTLCKYFNTKLVLNAPILEHLKERYKAFNVTFSKVNKDQAYLPKSCTILPNTRGSASGMWFDKDEIVYISLPGVPYEMKGILTDEVFPKLKTHFSPPNVIHKTIRTIGLPESKLAELLIDWENSLAEHNIKLAYLPSPGFVRLRISGVDIDGKIEKIIASKASQLPHLIGQYIYGSEKETIEKVVGDLLTKQQKTLCSAESCTGGNIGKLITNIPGSSTYYKGGIISYDNAVKINLLNVNKQDIIDFGAVSQQVVEQMAQNSRTLLNTDYSISTSGIAGPTGGTEDKPIGTVWVAIASKNRVISKMYSLPYNNRTRNIAVASSYALNLLRTEFLINN